MIKISILFQVIHIFYAIPIKYPGHFYRTRISTICMEPKKTTDRQNNIKRRRRIKRTKLEILIFPYLKQQYKSMATKTIWYWHNNRYIGQGNRLEDAEIN